MIYNVKVTEYNNETQVTYYSYGINKESDDVNDKTVKQRSKSSKQSAEDSKQDTNFIDKTIENRKRSTRRSKQSIYEIARANEWEWFATFTFAEDRYDYKLCKDRLRKFFNHFKERKCDNFEYLCVPEKHKDGAYHFHALIKGDIDSHLQNKGWNELKYVMPCFKLGIHEFERVKDTNRVAMYISKYISKDLLSDIGNARRYFYSKGLKKPIIKEYYVKENLFEFLENNFCDKNVVYVNTAEYGQNLIQYIQLKDKNFQENVNLGIDKE